MHRSPARIAAVLLGAMFLLLTWLLYKGDFWSLHTSQQKVDAIVEYASAEPEDTSSLRAVLHPEVVFDETIGDRRILVLPTRRLTALWARSSSAAGCWAAGSLSPPLTMQGA